MKLSLKNLRTMFFCQYSRDNPIFMFDVYTHTFTFVTIKEPRREDGIAFVLVLFKYRIHFDMYIWKPYVIKSKIMQKVREGWYGKE